MKKINFLYTLISIFGLLISCNHEKCICHCEGDITVINNTGTDVLFHVIEPSTSEEILWDWLLKNGSFTYTEIPKGEYTFKWETGSLSAKTKVILVSDCEETKVIVPN